MKLNRQTITSIATVTMIFLSASVYAQSEDSFNDAEIADIAVTANQIDIEYAEIDYYCTLHPVMQGRISITRNQNK